ncbi:MAG: type II toxin-antitoxin system VapC family toxin [Hyphomonadaceae bacterium]
MAELKRVYWDSCCWLGLINGEAKKIRAVDYVYNSAKAGGYEIWTSTISLIEVNRLSVEMNNPRPLADDGLDKIDEMFRQDCIKLIPLDMEIGLDARKLIRTSIKNKYDAVHLASALRWSLDALHTYDNDDLLHLDGKLKCKNGLPLKICEPDDPPDGPLFADKDNAAGEEDDAQETPAPA